MTDSSYTEITKRTQWIWKSVKLQKQSHPPQSPLGPLRVNWELRGTLVSSTLPAQTRGRMGETQPCWVDYTYITHTLLSAPSFMSNPPHNCCDSPSYFCWPVCGEVDRGEHTISRRPNTENWITPGLTSSERRLAYLHPMLSRGPFRADGDPGLAPRSLAPLPRLPGNMTTYTRPCQTNDWQVPAHLHQHLHRPQQITPKPRRIAITRLHVCSIVILRLFRAYAFVPD